MAEKNLLQNIYLFKGLKSEQMEAVSQVAELETYDGGSDVFSQNEPASALYVIKSGSIKISQLSESGDRIEVATLGAGAHFGEMPFIDGERRSATATSNEKSEIVMIDYEKLRSVLARDLIIASHVYREICHFLCGRLRVTTNDLSYARERNLRYF